MLEHFKHPCNLVGHDAFFIDDSGAIKCWNCSEAMKEISANSRQVGGQHYRATSIQHWDFAAANNLDYFQGQITKYVVRWKDKNGIEDLKKARHFLDKYIELAEQSATPVR
jgi:hypothetical protein